MPSDIIQTADYKTLNAISPQPSTTKRSAEEPLTRSQIIETVACILEEMIDERYGRYTDIKEVPNQTMFHAKKLAPISLKDYLMRFAAHSQCHEDAFVYALIYLDKVGENMSEFSLDIFNAYRIILVCLVLACKFNDDYYHKNSYYAKIGGVSTEELSKLEKEFLLNYIQFSLYVSSETYTEYFQDLVSYYHDKSQEKTS